jgi:hypothetical protein
VLRVGEEAVHVVGGDREPEQQLVAGQAAGLVAGLVIGLGERERSGHPLGELK